MNRILPALVLSALCIVSHFASVIAQDGLKKDDLSPKENPVAPLKVGDSAPGLKVTKWLQGDAVSKFEPNKVYVVEFWATWCVPCIRNMPHLAELQARYKDKGVTIIGFTSRDILGAPDNTEEKVLAFVKRRGQTLKYPFAYADDRAMADAWMKGQGHFCTFVVDKTGRIAYIGGPMYLDMVLPKVLAGEMTAKGVGDEMAKVDEDYRTVLATLNRDAEAGLRALMEFEAKYPALADCLPVVTAKLYVLLKHGNPDQQKEYAEALLRKAIKQNNVIVLEQVCLQLSDKKESKELVPLAVQAAEAIVRIDGGKDPYSLLRLAGAYLTSGDKAKARDYARKAIGGAKEESSSVYEYVEKEARRLGAEK